jgi:hypothetical protein
MSTGKLSKSFGLLQPMVVLCHNYAGEVLGSTISIKNQSNLEFTTEGKKSSIEIQLELFLNSTPTATAIAMLAFQGRNQPGAITLM